MKLLRYFGWALLVAAFGAAAAEVLVPPRPGTGSLFVPAYELWYTAWPGSLVGAQIRVERLAPFLWDPVIVTLLHLPAWMLLGLPGALLAWVTRSRTYADRRERAEVRKYEEAMMLYDDLARDARDQGMDAEEDDMLPDHSGHDTLDEIQLFGDEEDDELFSMERAEELRAQITARREEGRLPKPPDNP